MFRTLAFLLVASPACADDFVQFHTPSANIHCAISTGEWNNLRCDMFELTPSFPDQPAWCEFDWGSSFALERDGLKGEVACVSDTVADPTGPVLGYGESIELGGFTCQSKKTGLTCTNPAGHGFTLSKALQKLF